VAIRTSAEELDLISLVLEKERIGGPSLSPKVIPGASKVGGGGSCRSVTSINEGSKRKTFGPERKGDSGVGGGAGKLPIQKKFRSML